MLLQGYLNFITKKLHVTSFISVDIFYEVSIKF